MSEIKKINIGGTEYDLPEGGGASAHVEGDALVINNSGGTSSGTGSGSGGGIVDVTELPENPDPNVIYRVKDYIIKVQTNENETLGFRNGLLFAGNPINIFYVDSLPDNPLTMNDGANFYILNDSVYAYLDNWYANEELFAQLGLTILGIEKHYTYYVNGEIINEQTPKFFYSISNEDVTEDVIELLPYISTPNIKDISIKVIEKLTIDGMTTTNTYTLNNEEPSYTLEMGDTKSYIYNQIGFQGGTYNLVAGVVRFEHGGMFTNKISIQKKAIQDIDSDVTSSSGWNTSYSYDVEIYIK